MKKVIEIDENMLNDFRFRGLLNHKDGFDRGLWYDLNENNFFETCESKNTEYNLDDCVCLIFISGDNNSKEIDEICDGCSGIYDCEKKDVLYNVCFYEICDELFPINEFEDIEFEVV